jgi:hypothetical protein
MDLLIQEITSEIGNPPKKKDDKRGLGKILTSFGTGTHLLTSN